MALRVEVKLAPIVMRTASFDYIVDQSDLKIAMQKADSYKLGLRSMSRNQKRVYAEYLQLRAKGKPGGI